MWNVRFVTLVGIVVAATAMRLVPHPPNVTPIAAIALFGGAHFASKRAALAVPLLAMCLSDLLYAGALFGGFALAERRFPALRRQSLPVLCFEGLPRVRAIIRQQRGRPGGNSYRRP